MYAGVCICAYVFEWPSSVNFKCLALRLWVISFLLSDPVDFLHQNNNRENLLGGKTKRSEPPCHRAYIKTTLSFASKRRYLIASYAEPTSPDAFPAVPEESNRRTLTCTIAIAVFPPANVIVWKHHHWRSGEQREVGYSLERRRG